MLNQVVITLMLLFFLAEKKMEKALENTTIANSEEYRLTLKSFFKDQFKYSNDCYLIPFCHILFTKRQIFSYIQDSCGIVCSKLETCHGHQFMAFVELIYQYQRYCVIKKKVYFEYFLFNNFKLTSDIRMTLKPTKIKSWRMVGVHMQLIHELTYSERLSFLK